MRKTARPVVWEGGGAQSPSLDPIICIHPKYRKRQKVGGIIGNISATSEALFVHPNTLRQRLRRIQELSGLDLRKDDWLLIEIAVKMVKLQEVLGKRSERT